VPLSSYQFGEFELDRARYELRRKGRALKLERIPMELLILLVEKDGHVVTRQEIVERLWGKDVFVDTEHGINTAIRKIRAALREDAERPRYVQTVAGKGYRFVAELRNGNGRATPPPAVPAQVALKGGHARRAAVIAGAAVLLFSAALLAFNFAGLRDRLFARNQVGSIHSIAVLPLANLSGDPSQDYFADGMTDEIITMLAKNTSLRVVSRTSAMQYKGVRRPLRDVARSLGVDAILEGSIERSGHRVHMTVQLVRGDSDSHIWAESYDRDFNEVFSLPSDLAQTIAKEVKTAVSPQKAQRYVSPEAHDAYLHGRYFWFGRNYDQSQAYFEKAIQLQPNYAAAWSGLADSYSVRPVAGLSPWKEVGAKAEAAAHKAVELDDSLPEAHNSLAAIYLFGHWDWEHADEESRRAIELNPNYAEARHVHAFILLAMNRREEGLQEQRRSSEIDPFARPWALGWAYFLARQYDAAIKELRPWAETEPQDSYIHFVLAAAYEQKGMEKEWAEELEKYVRLVSNEKSAADVRRAFEGGGKKAVAEWFVNRYSRARASKRYVSPYFIANAYALLGRKKETLHYLEDAYREHSVRLVFLQNDPSFDFLHSDQRYRVLVRKVGLPPAY
jgi:TolB-like protein/DNA-binding winged helix-turn-helix (wHTH) protein